MVAAPAQAKSFEIPEATVNVLVESSGALEVGEQITFAYDGSFSGAYRDIPLRDGESISDVQVLEDRRAYTSGGCTELGRASCRERVSECV